MRPAERLDDRLVAEADAERRRGRHLPADDLEASRLEPSGRPGPGETTRCDGAALGLVGAIAVVPPNHRTSAPSS
jgi:hypothetical protein